MSRRRLSAAGLVGLEEAAGGPPPAPPVGDRGGLPQLATMPPLGLNGGTLSRDKVPDVDVVDLPLTAIRRNPRQPRRTFNEEAIGKLADSLVEHGRVLQPILVRPVAADDDGATYELVAGERRWRAAIRAEHPTIRAIVESVDDAMSAQIALVENMAREGLNPMDEARGCRVLRDTGLTNAAVGLLVGRAETAISHLVRLLALPDSVHTLIEVGTLTEGHGRVLLKLKDQGDQRRLAAECAEAGWSVSTLDGRVKALATAKARKGRRRKTDDRDALLARYGTEASRATGLDLEMQALPKGRVAVVMTDIDAARALVLKVGVPPFALEDGAA
jgi:ParB family chromosome partitioning protein